MEGREHTAGDWGLLNPLGDCDTEWCVGVTCSDEFVDDVTACAECSPGYEFGAPSTSHSYTQKSIGNLCDNTGGCDSDLTVGPTHPSSSSVCNCDLMYACQSSLFSTSIGKTYYCQKEVTRIIEEFSTSCNPISNPAPPSSGYGGSYEGGGYSGGNNNGDNGGDGNNDGYGGGGGNNGGYGGGGSNNGGGVNNNAPAFQNPANDSDVMLLAKSPVGMRRTYAEACSPGEYWNVAAFEATGGCYPCPPGTFVSTKDDQLARVGDGSYVCQSACRAGYTTPPGATSAAACQVGYSVRWTSSDPESCSGLENRATAPTNEYPNVGYAYVTSRDECKQAARLLSASVLNQSQGVLVPRLSMPCLSVDKGEIECGAPSSLNPSVGFCGIEYGNDKTAKNLNQQPWQALVFYPLPSNLGESLQRPTGAQCVAICKVVFCNHLEMIAGDGAVVKNWMRNGGPETQDDASCTSNPLQLNVWRKAEVSAYRNFYIVAGFITTLVLVASLIQMRKENSNNNAVSTVNVRQSLWQFVGCFNLAISIWDFLTDWGFYALAVTTPRLEFLIDESGLVGSLWVFQSFKTACFFFCMVSTICFPFAMHGFYVRATAVGTNRRPPERYVYFSLGVLCIVDLPQFILGIMYVHLTNKDPGTRVDTMAILSILMSLVGMTFTLLRIFKPEWFYETDKDVVAMPAGLIESKVKSWLSKSHSVNRQGDLSIADTLVARRQTMANQESNSRPRNVTINPNYSAAHAETAESHSNPTTPDVRIVTNAMYGGGFKLQAGDGSNYGTARKFGPRLTKNAHNHVKTASTALYGADGGRRDRNVMQNSTYGVQHAHNAGTFRSRSGSVFEVQNVGRDRAGTMQLAAAQEGVLYNVPFLEEKRNEHEYLDVLGAESSNNLTEQPATQARSQPKKQQSVYLGFGSNEETDDV